MQRLAFERALDKSPGESLAYPHWLRVVEVPPSSTGRALFHDGENPFPFIGVGSDILRKSEVTGVVQPAKDNEGTHLELASESFQVFGQLIPVNRDALQSGSREQELSGNLIAPTLSRVAWRGTHLGIVYSGFTKPDMDQLMGERENLSGLGVRSIDENDRGQLISKGMVWSPSHGDTGFTVPLFDKFMRRIMPGNDWRTVG